MQTNILVIDDSETIHKVIRLAFHQLNASITDCHSLTQASSLFEMGIENQKPDIVLADASLPGGGDGQAANAYASLQAKLGNVPFLILIGSYDSVDESSFEQVGLRSFIKKPFDSQDLVDKVGGLLGYQLSPKHIESSAEQRPSMFSAAPMPETKPPIPLVEDNTGDSKIRPSSVGINIPPPPKPKEKAEAEGNGYEHDAVAPKPSPLPPPPPSSSPISSLGVNGKAGFSLASEQDAASFAMGMRTVKDEASLTEEQFGEIAPDGTPQFSYRDTGDEYDIENNKKSLGMADSMLSDLLRDELRSMVKAAVLEYCDQHFKALAKEVITQEIQKLTELKSRLLIDN